MSITVAAVITIKVTAKAIACPRNASPGAPSKRKRTKGAVSRSGLLGRKDVAPNSPIEIAKANGYENVINYSKDDFAKKIMQLTNNNGGLFSLDGIGVYDNPSISRMGTASFTGATDGFIMMTYYNLTSNDPVCGIEILLDSYSYINYLSQAGGGIIVSLKDFYSVNEYGDTWSMLESDFYTITQEDI